MGVDTSTVSRVESGRHATGFRTLKKLGEAFGVRGVVGFESGAAETAEREIVVLWPSIRGRRPPTIAPRCHRRSVPDACEAAATKSSSRRLRGGEKWDAPRPKPNLAS
jgi:transcriptional regulator with XRE-family HTH domain